jgi:DNA-3-methyladenine glycosylase
MYGPPATAYVYFIYGLYHCFNVVTQEEGVPHAVLVRSLKPIENLDILSRNRFEKNYEELSRVQKKNLANGPSKLSMAFNLTKKQNGISLLGDELYIEEGNLSAFKIVSSKGLELIMQRKQKIIYGALKH